MAEAGVERGWRDRGRVRRWFAALSVYREPRLVAILLMGFSSGLPLALTGATLSLRLAEIGVSLHRDRAVHAGAILLQLQVPVVAGHRPAAAAGDHDAARAAARLGTGDPGGAGAGDPMARLHRPAHRSVDGTVLAAIVVAFLSASQDIVIDAYRIELLTPEEQGRAPPRRNGDTAFGMIGLGRGRCLCGELRRLGFRLCADGGADAGRHGDGVGHP